MVLFNEQGSKISVLALILKNMERFGVSETKKTRPADEPEKVLTGKEKMESGEREVVEMFRPLMDKMLSDVGAERVNEEPNFRNGSYSFA